jgi:hypothetical protein
MARNTSINLTWRPPSAIPHSMVIPITMVPILDSIRIKPY